MKDSEKNEHDLKAKRRSFLAFLFLCQFSKSSPLKRCIISQVERRPARPGAPNFKLDGVSLFPKFIIINSIERQ